MNWEGLFREEYLGGRVKVLQRPPLIRPQNLGESYITGNKALVAGITLWLNCATEVEYHGAVARWPPRSWEEHLEQERRELVQAAKTICPQF